MNTNDKTISNFDRLMGALHGLPDVSHTKPTTVRVVPNSGGDRGVTPVTGTSDLFIVQTYRQREAGDTIFLEWVSAEGTVRIPVPPAAADAIARQRETLTAKSRSKAARATAQARKEQGIEPAFLKRKKKASVDHSRKG